MKMCLTQNQRKTIHHLDQYIFMSERRIQYTQLEGSEKDTQTPENASLTKIVIAVFQKSSNSNILNYLKVSNYILFILLVFSIFSNHTWTWEEGILKIRITSRIHLEIVLPWIHFRTKKLVQIDNRI